VATDYSNDANRKAVLAERFNNQIEGLRMQDQTSLFNKLGEHVATIRFNESVGLWQIVVVQHEAMEFFCQARKWHSQRGTRNSIPRPDFRDQPRPGTPDA
jgi:hypothetical protein